MVILKHRQLSSLFSGLNSTVLFNEPMNKYTSFRIGGPAEAMVFPCDETEISEIFNSKQSVRAGIHGRHPRLSRRSCHYERRLIWERDEGCYRFSQGFQQRWQPDRHPCKRYFIHIPGNVHTWDSSCRGNTQAN